MSFDRVAELFVSKEVCLVTPAKWVDPLEKFLLESAQEIYRHYARKNIFVHAQCWSLNARSDALWNMYSQDRDGIRISTTIGNLRANLTATNKTHCKLFVGKVDYLPQKNNSPLLGKRVIKDLPKSFETKAQTTLKALRSSLEEREIAKLLLLKRKPFEHEDEIRLICTNHLDATDLLRLSIDPYKLIESIQIDPRMSSAKKNAFLNYFNSEQISFKNKYIKSTLYSIPKVLKDYVAKQVPLQKGIDY